MLDPAVPRVEALLAAAAARRPAPPTTPGGPRLPVEHALWICACVSMDDAPVWLLYGTADGGFGWTADPEADEPLDLVDARFEAGAHLAPADVLAWLSEPRPARFGDCAELRVVLDALKGLCEEPPS